MVGPSDGNVAHVRFRCKSYKCAVCGPRKLRRVRKAIVRHAVGLQLQRFLTLTLDPKKFPAEFTPKEAVAYLRDCWRKMRVSIQRQLGRSLTFIAVVELHQSGLPHLHVLVGSFLPQSWISQAWQAIGGGRIVDIRRVQIKRVAAYLSNYITKEKMLDAFPDGVRRFSTSRGLSLFDRSKGGSGWYIVRFSITLLHAKARTLIVGTERFELDTDGAPELISFLATAPP
jgi:hypothetical protein